MRLFLLSIPDDYDFFDIDMRRHVVFYQVKDVAFDFGYFPADSNSLATNFDFFAQAVFKKIPHNSYSFAKLISVGPRFYSIVLPIRKSPR